MRSTEIHKSTDRERCYLVMRKCRRQENVVNQKKSSRFGLVCYEPKIHLMSLKLNH